jgi:glycosyltransferase involved in cell wall biosynthesis
MTSITICIPTYEFNGKGVFYLNQIFDSLRSQTFQDFNIVISDHSIDDKIFNYSKNESKNFKITYVRNPNGRGFQAHNTNCAFEYADGEIIKLIYQDDIFVNDTALELIYKGFEKSDSKWMMHGFAHTNDGKNIYRKMIPRWTDMLLEGRNLLGSPSCFACLNEAKMYMDENIKLLIDTELYHRMRYSYGLPIILHDILVANREHSDRMSSSGINYNMRIEHPEGSWLVNEDELVYVTEKHKDTRRYPDED